MDNRGNRASRLYVYTMNGWIIPKDKTNVNIWKINMYPRGLDD